MDMSDVSYQEEGDFKSESYISLSTSSINNGISYENEVMANDNINISGFLYDMEGNGLSNQTISLHIDSDDTVLTYDILTDNEGFFSYSTIVPVDINQYMVQVEFNGSDEYLPCVENMHLTVVDKDISYLTIDFNPYIKPNEELLIHGMLSDSNNDAIVNQDVSILIYDDFEDILRVNNITTDEYGYYNYATNIFNQSGNYYIQVYYPGNEDYFSSENFNELTVSNKRETFISFYKINTDNNVLVISGQLTDDENNAIVNESLNIIILYNEDEIYNIDVLTDENGTFTSGELSVNHSGDYDVVGYYAGNEDYLEVSAYTSISDSDKESTSLDLNYIPDEMPLFDDLEISGHLTNSIGNALANQSIIIRLSSDEAPVSERTVITDDEGYFCSIFKLDNVSEYDVDVIYDGNENYLKTEEVASFKVINLTTPVLTIDNYTVIQKNKTVSITGQLMDIEGNPIVNKTLNVILFDRFNSGYEVITDADGVYQLTINNPSDTINEYKIEVQSPIDDRYSSTYIFDSFSFEGIITSLSVSFNNSEIYGALMDKNGNGLINKDLTIEVNDESENKTITDNITTDESGNYVYKYNLDENHAFTIKVTFEGDEGYASSDISIAQTRDVKIEILNPEIVNNTVDVVYNGVISVANKSGDVEFNLINITTPYKTQNIPRMDDVVLSINVVNTAEVTNTSNLSSDNDTSGEVKDVSNDTNTTDVTINSAGDLNNRSIIPFSLLVIILAGGIVYYIRKP